MSVQPDKSFCGHCGDRLPSYGAELGFCSPCALLYRVKPTMESVRNVTYELRHPQGRRDPALAAVLALIFPGAGQIYNGHWIKAGLVFFLSPFVIPWLIGIVDAYLSARERNLNEEVRAPAAIA